LLIDSSNSVAYKVCLVYLTAGIVWCEHYYRVTVFHFSF